MPPTGLGGHQMPLQVAKVLASDPSQPSLSVERCETLIGLGRHHLAAQELDLAMTTVPLRS